MNPRSLAVLTAPRSAYFKAMAHSGRVEANWEVAVIWRTPISGLSVTQSRLYPFHEQTIYMFRAGTIVSRKREARHERKR